MLIITELKLYGVICSPIISYDGWESNYSPHDSNDSNDML